MRHQNIPLYRPPVRYRIRTPETWEKVRRDYVAGVPAREVAERHDVGLSSLRQKARAEGWRRRDLADPEPIDPAEVAVEPRVLGESAWARAARAVEHGRVLEAQRWFRLAADCRALARRHAAVADALLAAYAEEEGPFADDAPEAPPADVKEP